MFLCLIILTFSLLSCSAESKNESSTTIPETTAADENSTTVKDKNEWLKIFSSESFENVTFEIESMLEEGSSYSKIIFDGSKARAAEKIESKEAFESKSKYYLIESNTYKIWDPNDSVWNDSYTSVETGREMVIDAVFDENVLLYARDYYENYVYDEQKQAYVWNTQNAAFEFYILCGKCVKMIFSMGELSIVTELHSYGTSVVNYPDGAN